MSSGQAVADQPTLFLAELTAPDPYVATSHAGDSNSAVDVQRLRADDEAVVEYAGVLAAVSLLALTVGGQLGGRLATLPSTTPAALESLTTGARAEKVPVSGARAAYARAPYGKPVLKYLYAVGWIGGAKHRSSCAFTKLRPESAEREAASELQGYAKVMKQLRRRAVTAQRAASALVAGVVSAC